MTVEKNSDENKQTEAMLSNQEQEHLTYLAVYEKYNEYKQKRISYKRYGMLFIIISGLAFLVLMFSLESKIAFLCLWIISVIFCIVLMIRADYIYNEYKEMLGLRDEFDEDFSSDDESSEKPPENEYNENQSSE